MANPGLTDAQLQEALSAVKAHGTISAAARALGLSRNTLQHRYHLAVAKDTQPDPIYMKFTPPAPSVDADLEKHRASASSGVLKQKYAAALKTIEQLRSELGVVEALNASRETFEIKPRERSGTSEGTVVVLASDWHVEERVDPGTVSGLNTYDLDIAKERATQFWQGVLRLTRLLQQDITINEMLIGLLGDFITGQIHEAENAESNQLTPNFAVGFARDLLISGIEFLLNHSQCRLTFVCHSGNHARTTKRTRFGTENGHSLEFLMYQHIAAVVGVKYKERVTFIIPEGMHSYITVYDKTIRFQHGHAIKYGGGVGGIYIPTHKAIAQWDRARHADLTCFGHFHQLVDGGSFICNGSLIGYNSFALSIKASYEPPKQTLFLMDRDRGRTCLWPVLMKDRSTVKAKKAA